MDSVPLVCITGQVVTWLLGRDGFQEADITGITIPITKHNELVLNVEDIAPAIAEAFHIATTGRPGPVLVDIPRDVQQQLCEFEYPDKVDLPGYQPTTAGHPNQMKRAAQLIAESGEAADPRRPRRRHRPRRRRAPRAGREARRSPSSRRCSASAASRARTS